MEYDKTVRDLNGQLLSVFFLVSRRTLSDCVCCVVLLIVEEVPPPPEAEIFTPRQREQHEILLSLTREEFGFFVS